MAVPVSLAHAAREVTGAPRYGTTKNIVAIEEAGLRAYRPLPDFEHRTPFYGKQHFTYDADQDQYHCLRGVILRRRQAKYTERVTVYRADAASCNACPLKIKCTASNQGRTIKRSFDEADVERVRAHQRTAAYKKALRKRQVWGEPLFGEAKAWHGVERFRFRMLETVNLEAVMIATGHNLKRLHSWRSWGQRCWPGGAPGGRPYFLGSNAWMPVEISPNRPQLATPGGCEHRLAACPRLGFSTRSGILGTSSLCLRPNPP